MKIWFMLFTCIGMFQTAMANIDILVPSEVPGQQKIVELHTFVEEHRYEKATELRTVSDTYRNVKETTKDTCKLAAAYELAALLAGDTDLIAWANHEFGSEQIEKFIQGELDLQEAIFNSLIKDDGC